MEYIDKLSEIKSLIKPLIESEAIELVDIELKGNVGNQVLKIFVDLEGGIKLSRCESLSREIANILDMEDTMPGKYRLEVSSPGTDRPLKTISDFRRNISRRVSLFLTDGRKLEGNIEKINEANVFLELDDGNRAKYSIELIESGKILLPF